MSIKVVPFTARITQQDSSATVATQMQTLIDSHSGQGWQYLRMDSVQTYVAGNNGCFGIGATPGFSTTYNVLVFTKAE